MKKLMCVIGFVLCSIIIGCSSKDSGKQTSLYEDDSKEILEKETDVSVTKDSTTEESSTCENITEEVILQNGYIFSTEYEVEDYCCGYFIVSKMDKRLYGVLDNQGNEVIPLKYDSLKFYNKTEVEDGRDEEIYFLYEYERESGWLGSNGEKTIYRASVKPYLGEQHENVAYCMFKGAYSIMFYDDKDNLMSEAYFGEPICDYYPLTKDYYLVQTEKGWGLYNIDLCNKYNDKESNAIWQVRNNAIWQAGDKLIVKRIDNEVIVGQSVWGGYIYYSMNFDGEWREVEGYYGDWSGEGIYKGVRPQDVRYVLGENDDIYLKYSNDTWKLSYSDGTAVYEDRYFDMYSDDERYFFLVNNSNNIVLIDRNAKIIESFDVFTPTESNASLPDFKGSNLYYDSVFEGTDALYIVRKNKEQYDIYRYGVQ